MKQTVLITGANRGIGLQLATVFVRNSYEVLGAVRSTDTKSLEDIGVDVLYLDLEHADTIKALEHHLVSRNIRLDILINNAGIGPDLGFDKPTESTFRKTLEVNVIGTTLFTESVIQCMKEGGKMINISSKMGSIACCQSTDSVAYRMSKTALNMYSKILTNRTMGTLKVATIHPGWVKTNISESSSLYGRLEAGDSAKRIYQFISSDFDTGVFWDVEDSKELEW